jgi:hypothetical protein
MVVKLRPNKPKKDLSTISPIYANNEFESTCIQLLHSNLQEDGRKWVGLLEGIGGKIELTKTFYYLLSWGWDRNGSPYPQPINEQPPNLSRLNIRSEEDPPKYIYQKDISQSHKTLGVYKSICSDETDQITALQEKSANIVARLRCGQLNRRQAKMAYNCNYIPAMLYSLPATCLTDKQLYKVQRKAIGKLIQIMGFEEKFPRAAVFGPFNYGGIGLFKLIYSLYGNQSGEYYTSHQLFKFFRKIYEVELNMDTYPVRIRNTFTRECPHY